ncbi:PXA domain-containing protein [Aspergillus saccharolyticus JOP 1030-1]|uniref:PXA domain protein n=1 Tax=Aspergillus saccharolyticus JOP 1030-1 TaxID=1450539 RepID=A0A319A7U6_9EURO|nr:PXA domain protein [Aspergillus saccharolyticus JOP 1030-1]PYH43242.1 PXA domain protein [Aspergillus saccharolyticus JOP 1030-1]
MTSDPLRPGLHPLSQLKAGPTTSSSKSTALSASSIPPLPASPRPSRPQLSKTPTRDDTASATSDKATVALIRRVLCPQPGNHGSASTPPPLEELLPPLTSSNELDRQLYALLAIVVKEFVLSWYSKITADQVFINELIQVIAHCTRALEQWIRETDVAQLVLDEIPALIETHISSYRLAKRQSELSELSPTLREIYHSLNPHPGLSPVRSPSNAQSIAQQEEVESIYRQLLVQGTLAILLPTEDLENVCLRTILGDIMADLILGNAVAGKISDGCFILESLTKVVDNAGRESRQEDAITAQSRQRSRLHEYGLISSREELLKGSSHPPTSVPVPDWTWQILQFGYLAYVTLRFIVVGLFRVSSTNLATSSRTSTSPTSKASETHSMCTSSTRRPVLKYRLYSMLAQLLDIPRRMPWLGGFLALLQHLILAGPGKLGDTDSVLDR